MKETREIVIKDFTPEMAATVADMWNRSREGWGGHGDIKTKEQVQNEQGNSTNLHTYIAIDGEEAVGYCGLSEYRDDTGALYIPLLNVRTDYHGRKIGKKLVLTALKETINRKWPRLDLYTWPGNTKAVPLYKKCGFFWENRDDTVHLMNFLPMVLNTEAFADFFRSADWYSDSVREISTEPDGRKSGDFELYDYHWEKDGRILHVAVEKTGRGISAVKTENYSIEMKLDSHTVIHGKNNKAVFYIENYTDGPLEIEITGKDDRNISFPLSLKETAGEKAVIEGSFTAEDSGEEQGDRKTHPAVTAEVLINGEKIVFKTGVLPLPPVNMTGKLSGRFTKTGAWENAFIELGNNCPEAVQLKFTLPEMEEVEFREKNYEVRLEKKEKKTVPVKFFLKKPAFINADIPAIVETEAGDTLTCSGRAAFAFNSPGSRISGECSKYYHLFSGLVHVALSKESNTLIYERGRSNKSDYSFSYPKLGKPFSEEFSIMKPAKVRFYSDEWKNALELTYLSRDFPGAALTRCIELTGDGLLNHFYRLENRGPEKLNSLQLQQTVNFPLIGTYIPYRGKIVFNDSSYNSEVNIWEEKDITGNWLFSDAENENSSLIWNEELPLHFQNWFRHYFEEALPELGPGQSAESKPLVFGQRVFSAAEEVLEFAGGRKDNAVSLPEKVYSLEVDGGNPFVSGKAGIKFSSAVTRSAETELFVYTNGGDKKQKHASFYKGEEENWSSLETEVPVPSGGPQILPVTVEGKMDSQHIAERLLLFPEEEATIKTEEIIENGKNVFLVNNGVFTMKAAPDFYPCIYSLHDGETEWLDSSFPEAHPKSWWNPWVGGISFGLEGLIQRRISQMPSEAVFITCFDQFRNEWKGIRLTTRVEDHEEFAGLVLHQYAVTRPGAPLLSLFTEIEQNTGRHFYGKHLRTFMNINKGRRAGELTVSVNEGGKKKLFSHHRHEADISQLDDCIFEKKDGSYSLHYVPDIKSLQLELFMNEDIVLTVNSTSMNTESGTREMADPRFLVLARDSFSLEDYRGLRQLRFTVN